MTKKAHLSSGDLANDLSPVRRHDGAEGANDGLEDVVAAVLNHADEQVLGQHVHLELVASAGEAVGLQLLLHRRVCHELVEPI